jgi:hypothetical protein
MVLSPEFCTEIGWRKIKTCGLVTSILQWNWMKKSQNMWSCHLNFALKLDEEKSKHVILSLEFCTEIGWRKVKTCGVVTLILHWNWMKKNQNMWSSHLHFALKLDEEKSKHCGLVTSILHWNWMKKSQNMWSCHLNFGLKLNEENSKHVVFSPQFCTEIGWRKVKTCDFVTWILHWNWLKKSQNKWLWLSQNGFDTEFIFGTLCKETSERHSKALTPSVDWLAR